MNKIASHIVVGDLSDERIEIAERKGIGHPDTICDEITEEVSRALCKYYLETFGAIMHHNVDKALLIGGQSEPAYGGGKIIKPLSLIISGRATHQVKKKKVPVEEIAVTAARNWLQDHIRHLDAFQDVRISAQIRPGSADLVELFSRFGKGEVPLANDTSFGAGYYPLTALEETIIRTEKLLNHSDTKFTFPVIGEDIKVMGVKDGQDHNFTIAIAMIDQYITDLHDYMTSIGEIKALIHRQIDMSPSRIYINTADNYEKESLYLTVTGTSAESGDDGQVGRGNRINGLITPYKPMSLEATSGKNPVSHIGKIYNYLAMDMSKSIVDHGLAEEAQVYIVAQIGKPIDQPQLLHFKLKNRNADFHQISDLAKNMLNGLADYWKRISGLHL